MVWLGWIVSTVFMSGTLLSAWWFYRPDYEYDALVAALYGALYRTTWAAGVSWTIIAVSTGNGGKYDRRDNDNDNGNNNNVETPTRVRPRRY